MIEKGKDKNRKRKEISISLKPRLMNRSSHLGKAKEWNLTARVVGKTKRHFCEVISFIV